MRAADLPPLTALELASAGHTLFGTHWRAELAVRFDLPDDALIRAVEAGAAEAPSCWRARLIAAAQDMALRAMDAASALLWRGDEARTSAA
jgi:hypothetical protein